MVVFTYNVGVHYVLCCTSKIVLPSKLFTSYSEWFSVRVNGEGLARYYTIAFESLG